MTSPPTPIARVPPTEPPAAPPWPQGSPYAVLPGQAPAGDPPRPAHLGVAAGCTIGVGVLSLLVGFALVMGAAFIGTLLAWIPVVGVMGGGFAVVLLVLSLAPVGYGIFAVAAGAGLNKGRPSSWTYAVVANVLSVAFALPSAFAGGFGLLHGGLSAIALWALFQEDTKAFFGRR